MKHKISAGKRKRLISRLEESLRGFLKKRDSLKTRIANAIQQLAFIKRKAKLSDAEERIAKMETELENLKKEIQELRKELDELRS